MLRNEKLLQRKTLDMLYKIIVCSVIDYRVLHFTSKDKLNSELGWETIDTRIKFVGLSLFHKIHLRLTRPLVRNCLSQLDWEGNKGGYMPYPN